MKTRLVILLLAALLSACQTAPVPRAYGVKPVAPITRGCRYTATWGAPEVHWIDNTNGHRWTCSYADFFRYCGGKHPNALGIAVKGQLPPEIASPAIQPAPAAKYVPTYSTPQSCQ